MRQENACLFPLAGRVPGEGNILLTCSTFFEGEEQEALENQTQGHPLAFPTPRMGLVVCFHPNLCILIFCFKQKALFKCLCLCPSSPLSANPASFSQTTFFSPQIPTKTCYINLNSELFSDGSFWKVFYFFWSLLYWSSNIFRAKQ